MSGLLQMPKLGFGFMRLPEKENEEIDDTELNSMVDETIKNGFVYFDTAYVYYGGESERAIKRAVVDRYPRDSFFIADKLPAWELKSKEDIQRIFDESLERTGVDYFDFYLLHSAEGGNLTIYDKFNCWEWAMKLKSQGLIRHFGFSFHGSPELLDKILAEHPEVEFVQLQINYVDWENKIVQSGGCYDVARKHNTPIVIMGPVKGGTLAALRPEWEIRLKAVAPERSIASWAMRYCLSFDGVAVILSGMSTMEQVADNIATVKNFKPFSDEEKACLNVVTQEFLSAPNIGCTDCRYCTDGNGCPMGINIPGVISAYNTVLTYGNHARPHHYYMSITENGEGKANSCTKCGKCESLCPQHLNIIEVLEKAAEIFDVSGMSGIDD
jgi:predicted aldo/keto reductase-like oxidoreductase